MKISIFNACRLATCGNNKRGRARIKSGMTSYLPFRDDKDDVQDDKEGTGMTNQVQPDKPKKIPG